MRYVLVDKNDNIVYKTTLTSNIGISGARTYFMGIKKLDLKEFDKLLNIIEHKKTVYRGMEILKRAKSYIASVEKIYNELISSKGYNFEENPNFKLDIN